MKKGLIVLAGLFLIATSCKKENPVVEPVNTPDEELNGVWIEGSWKYLYTDADSIISNDNWTVSDTVYDINSTYVHWTNDNDSLKMLTTYLNNDTAWVSEEYVGDGYNNDVTTVDVTGSSYLINDVISVDGVNYTILNYEPNGEGLDDDYRYFVELEINAPLDGCKFYLELFKRQAD